MRSVRRVFQVDGYEGDYSVTVPDGVQKGGMFQFDGDLKRCATASRLSRVCKLRVWMFRLPEGVPPKEGSSYQEQASAMMAGGASMLAGTKVCTKPRSWCSAHPLISLSAARRPARK